MGFKRFLKGELNFVQIVKIGIMAGAGGFGVWAIFKVINLLEAILRKL